jgi:hypothetical protein
MHGQQNIKIQSYVAVSHKWNIMFLQFLHDLKAHTLPFSGRFHHIIHFVQELIHED